MAEIAEIVLCAASGVAGCLVAPVGRLCGNVISYDSHVRKLEAKVAELDDARKNMQHSIEVAENNVKPIKPNDNEWLDEVKKHAEEARRVLDDDERAKNTCFYRWLPNVRYRLGRKARRKAEDIQGLIDGKPSGVVYDDFPSGLVDGTSDTFSSAGDRGATIFESRASILEDIMNALDDEKHKVVGVFGPGGVGKSTLLRQVEAKLRKQKKPFQMIVKAEVSRTPDLNDIRGQIADALNLNLKDKESPQGKRDLLFRRLQKDPNEKVLIILDDLWEELDLEAVGIPSGDTSGKCKLLLASRFKGVLQRHMVANQPFSLEGLNNDEAFKLFEETIGDRLKDEEELKVIADQVVKKLAGLPLLIKSVAKTLKHSDEHAWRNARIEINESTKKIEETILKLSYDHLKSGDAKDLFLLCGLIGGTIRVKLLFVLAMGLGLLGRLNKTMPDKRDRLNIMLDELRSACLLLDGGDDKDNVTIHDLYSEVVVSTPFRGQNSLMTNSNYDLWPQEELDKCWAICLDDVGEDRLAVLMPCQFPSLKILMLSMPKVWSWEFDHRHDVGDCSRLLDFMGMKELRVLYLGSMRITNLLSSIEILGNLRSLYLDHCNVGDVAIIGKLRALQILDFTGSTISRLPKEIGDLTNLRLLNLSNCKLKIIESGALKGLINLEELYMKGSLAQWVGVNEMQSELCNARLAELKSLKKLTSLEISIRDPTILLGDDDLPFGNLISFWIDIGNVRKTWRRERGTLWREYEGLKTMKLKLKGCDSVLSREWVKKTLEKTQCLLLDGMREFKENALELCIGGSQRLKHLCIENSPSIQYITSSSDAFPNLESLSLFNLDSLEWICYGFVPSECLSKLKIVKVVQCNRLKYLWCVSQMQRLVQLEQIKVSRCDSMRAIVTDDAGKDIGSSDNIVELPNATAGITSESAPIQVSLPHLIYLRIESCHSFGAFILSPTSAERPLGKMTKEDDESPQPLFNEMVTFPKLRELTIQDTLCKELWNNQIPTDSFCTLEFLRLECCDNLQCIAPSQMWKRLRRCLETLVVISCGSIEIIYKSDDMDTEGGKLRNLYLCHLENLRHIWQYGDLPNIPFPNLRYIVARSCPRLEVLLPTSMAEFLGQIEVLIVCSCKNMEIIAGHGECEEVTGTTISFFKLTRVYLDDLPKFRSYLPEKYSAKFPRNISFSLHGCGTEPNQCVEPYPIPVTMLLASPVDRMSTEIEETWSESEGDEGEDLSFMKWSHRSL